jgi:hypothetical protein
MCIYICPTTAAYSMTPHSRLHNLMLSTLLVPDDCVSPSRWQCWPFLCLLQSDPSPPRTRLHRRTRLKRYKGLLGETERLLSQHTSSALHRSIQSLKSKPFSPESSCSATISTATAPFRLRSCSMCCSGTSLDQRGYSRVAQPSVML